MGHAEKRKHRVAWLMSRIKEGNSDGNCWREDILISEACLQFGAGKRYIKELLTDLVNTKQIVLDLGEVYTKDRFALEKARENIKGVKDAKRTKTSKAKVA